MPNSAGVSEVRNRRRFRPSDITCMIAAIPPIWYKALLATAGVTPPSENPHGIHRIIVQIRTRITTVRLGALPKMQGFRTGFVEEQPWNSAAAKRAVFRL